MFRLFEARFLIIENKESALDSFCNLLPPPALELLFTESPLLFCCDPATQDPFVAVEFRADRGLNARTVEF